MLWLPLLPQTGSAHIQSSAVCCGLHYLLVLSAGLPNDWYPNLDALKESCRIASSYNWADVDLSPFQGIINMSVYILKSLSLLLLLFIKRLNANEKELILFF